jgi:hypothetical protein
MTPKLPSLTRLANDPRSEARADALRGVVALITGAGRDAAFLTVFFFAAAFFFGDAFFFVAELVCFFFAAWDVDG